MIKKFRASNYINAWYMTFDNVNYVVMPAHCAMFKDKSGKVIRSDFLNHFDEKLNWFTTENWINKGLHQYDFAWTKSNPSQNKSSFSHKLMLKSSGITDVSFYYNQPCDIQGNLTKVATFGKLNGTVYESPNSCLLEAVNIGFKGMSGAICVKDNKLVGMFVGRAKDLGSDTRTLPRGIILPCKEMLKNIRDKNIVEI